MQTQRGGNERSGPWKKSRSQRKGMMKLRHMPKSPDPSSTFPHYTKSIFHCLSVPPPTSPASTLPGKYVFFLFALLFFLLLKLFPSVPHLAALRSRHVAPHPLSAPSKSVSFFLLSCLLLTLVSGRCPCMSPPFVDTTCCTCPRLLLCKSFIFIFVVLHLLTLLMPRPSLPHAASLSPSCRVPPSMPRPSMPRPSHVPPASHPHTLHTAPTPLSPAYWLHQRPDLCALSWTPRPCQRPCALHALQGLGLGLGLDCRCNVIRLDCNCNIIRLDSKYNVIRYVIK